MLIFSKDNVRINNSVIWDFLNLIKKYMKRVRLIL